MNYKAIIFTLFITATLISCGSSQKTTSEKSNIKAELDEKNRTNFTLLERIIQMPGIINRNGKPVFAKTSNSFSNTGTQEPLYILDGYELGNSFSSLNEAVKSFNVKKIRILSSADAAMYGTRAANGVIIVTTYK
ncbi:TonB-dependent receptor plug domain-containing protein [Maribacter sp. LLG6340-A2]|uniref:TonB-dependent receptor plug domain-containing protein n=1 Tax=Maribacter sp. LLG6340-A2 TaxID=3160834 RepID=UPI003866265B